MIQKFYNAEKTEILFSKLEKDYITWYKQGNFGMIFVSP